MNEVMQIVRSARNLEWHKLVKMAVIQRYDKLIQG